MSIRRALFSSIFLIFQIFMFAVCYNKIIMYDLYFGEGETPQRLSFPTASDRATVAFSTRIVMDLFQRTYVDKGIIFITSEISAIFINGECDVKRPCRALEWLTDEQLAFECLNVCRYLTFEGNMSHFRVDMTGYYLFTENLAGCFINNETMTVNTESLSFKCPSSHMLYFGLQETDSGLLIVCIRSLFHLKRVKLRECNVFCNSAPRRFCGGSGKLLSVYSYTKAWGIDLPTECFYHSTYCPTCPEGREGLNCERVVCTKDNGRCGNGICESLDDFNIAVCYCDNGFDIFVGRNRFNCYDEDECETVKCDSNAIRCLNNPGSYICVCKDGFINMGPSTCEDIDECASSPCGSHAGCENSPGSFHCECHDGFQLAGPRECIDLDECENNPCDLMSTYCKNTIGNFSCECRSGFLKLTHILCGDVDECDSIHPCEVVTTYCKNLPGSFECKCKGGFSREDTLKCKDVDECSLLLHNCGKALCTNTIGSFRCECPLGTETIEYNYAMECQDIDECNTANKCNKTISVCLNLIRGYVCQCFSGYMNTDNFTCIRDSRTRLTTIDDLDDDVWYTTTEYSVATGGDYDSDSTMEYMFLLPVLLFSVAIVLWCFIYTKRGKSFSSTLSTVTSFGRASQISRQSQI